MHLDHGGRARSCFGIALGFSFTLMMRLSSDSSAAEDVPRAAGSNASAKSEDAALATKLREQAKSRVLAMTLRPKDATAAVAYPATKNPLLTYTDERLCIDSGTVWVWTNKDQGVPVALCKVEHYDVTRIPRAGEWLYCFASMSRELIHAEWPDGHQWLSRKPGVVYRDIPNAPAAGDTAAKRLRQMKQIVQQFSATFDLEEAHKEELRLLSQPLLRYADVQAGVLDGALFTATMDGTNPTAIFLIELQRDNEQANWRFAVAPMTDGGVTVKYEGKEVLRKTSEYSPGKDFETWTYFFESKSVSLPPKQEN